MGYRKPWLIREDGPFKFPFFLNKTQIVGLAKEAEYQCKHIRLTLTAVIPASGFIASIFVNMTTFDIL